MSKALKCDRCGTLYEIYGSGRKGFNSVAIISKDNFGTYDEVEKYDLCPECMKEVLKIMNEKKEKRTNDKRRACDRKEI